MEKERIIQKLKEQREEYWKKAESCFLNFDTRGARWNDAICHGIDIATKTVMTDEEHTAE